MPTLQAYKFTTQTSLSLVNKLFQKSQNGQQSKSVLYGYALSIILGNDEFHPLKSMEFIFLDNNVNIY